MKSEANAIATEYLRIGVLADVDTDAARQLLRGYLNHRVLFYDTEDPKALERLETGTAQLQAKLWNAVRSPALAQPTPVTALAVSGMNDVLQCPTLYSSSILGSDTAGCLESDGGHCDLCEHNDWLQLAQRETGEGNIFILPIVLAISFMLIADIDSPRGGLIHVRPLNLESLARWLPTFHGTMLEDDFQSFRI